MRMFVLKLFAKFFCDFCSSGVYSFGVIPFDKDFFSPTVLKKNFCFAALSLLKTVRPEQNDDDDFDAVSSEDLVSQVSLPASTLLIH